MKLRTGFVSNSSSSSFAIFGIEEDKDTLAALLNAKQEKKDLPEGVDPEDVEDDIDSWEVREMIEEKGLSCYDDESGNLYVGMDALGMGEDETKRQFKERIASKLKEVFGKDFTVDFFSGEYPC